MKTNFYLSNGTTRWLRRLASPMLAFCILPWLMVLLVAGTVAQPSLGLYEAQRIFFGSAVLWLGPLPLPGAYMALGLLGAGLAAKVWLDWPFTMARAGIILTHSGVLILLIGGLVTAMTNREGYIMLGDGDSSRSVMAYAEPAPGNAPSKSPAILERLPFTLRLVHFDKSDYPGTEMARTYSSDVVVTDHGLTWPARIEMNKPLRHLGYTFYQSSYVKKDGRLMTVLAVVHNAGALFPYLAITMLCLGLVIHGMTRSKDI